MDNLNFQVIWDSVSTCFLIALPFSLVLTLISKITNFFLSFVFGSKEVSL